MDKTSLGNRMKENYENRERRKLTRRTPVILRLDGVAFHTYTKGFVKPFDYILMDLMQKTTKRLCDKIQGAEFAYTQSDEISIFLKDYNRLTSEAWFDYNVQKMCSVAASMATRIFADEVDSMFEFWKTKTDWQATKVLEEFGVPPELDKAHSEGFEGTTYRYGKKAFFDCRAFNIPKEEVVNYFIWRQQDATRNSIQMLGQHHFSHKELQHKNCNNIQDMLWKEKGINWDDIPVPCKRGIAVHDGRINRNIPVFTQDKEFIEKHIEPKEGS